MKPSLSFHLRRLFSMALAISLAGIFLAGPGCGKSGPGNGAPSAEGAGEVNSELDPALKGPVYTPISVKKYFQGEREQFGYNPSFVPNVVTFDPDNRPYIRTHEGILQILQDDGVWKKVDLVAEAKKRFDINMASIKNWTEKWHGNTKWESLKPGGPLLHSSDQNDERVVFDESGDAYTVLHTGSVSNIDLNMLLHSQDGGLTWEVYPIPKTESGCDARIEHQDGSNDLTNPPGILVYCHWVENGAVKSILEYMDVTKNEDKTLDLRAVHVADDSFLGAGASSFPNYMATRGDLTHIVYIGGNFKENADGRIVGTPPNPDYVRTYVRSYDHKTKNLSAPVFVGATSRSTAANPAPDDHEYPGICVDSKGIVHVIIGAHGLQLRYTHSVKPDDISEWTPPVGIGEADDKDYKGLYSYPELVCDSDDTIHVVARSSGLGNRYKLVYLQKKAGQDWTVFGTSETIAGENRHKSLKHKTLLNHWHWYYGNWYHKSNADRKGRLFVNYVSLIDNLFSDEAAAYQIKWPEDGLAKDDPNCVNNSSETAQRTSPNCPGLDCEKVIWPQEGAPPLKVTDECKKVCQDSPCWYSRTVKAHDPAMIMSDDRGDTWRLATTRDFLEGMGLEKSFQPPEKKARGRQLQ